VGVSTESSPTTTYAYDTLDDLQTVTQGSETRTFTYDSLKRLVRAINPESGTISYAYDLSGNLVSRTGGAGTTTWGVYDGLNRPPSKAYSGGSVTTPNVTYCYDGNLLNPATQACGTIAPATGSVNGRLTGVGTSVSTTNYTNFTNRGFMGSTRQTTGGTDYTFLNYGYYLNGELKAITYPSGRQITYGVDSVGRINGVTGTPSSGSPTNYASGIQYAPFNVITQITMLNGIVENRGYSSDRMQPISVTAAKGTAAGLSLGYSYCSPKAASCSTNNGNLQSQTITPSTSTWTQTYTYDSLNRLVTAAEAGTGGWSEGYGYDTYGNRWVTSPVGLPTLTLETPVAQSWYNAQNRIGTWGYDGGGNVTQVASMTRSFTYDVENRQATATIAGLTTSYAYDGEGKRVQKTSPSGATTVYAYDGQGQLAAEYVSAGSTDSPCRTCYLTTDYLGSTRMLTDGSGAVVARHDYAPFGEELVTTNRTTSLGYVTDTVTEKFTGKERDAETSLDFFEARYMSSAQGRFTSPDPAGLLAAKPANPQSWNLYAYAMNNPLSNTDPSGKDCV